jgi:hypothetical protein
MKPALVTVTRTLPVIACEGFAKQMDAANAVSAKQKRRPAFMKLSSPLGRHAGGPIVVSRYCASIIAK